MEKRKFNRQKQIFTHLPTQQTVGLEEKQGLEEAYLGADFFVFAQQAVRVQGAILHPFLLK